MALTCVCQPDRCSPHPQPAASIPHGHMITRAGHTNRLTGTSQQSNAAVLPNSYVMLPHAISKSPRLPGHLPKAVLLLYRSSSASVLLLYVKQCPWTSLLWCQGRCREAAGSTHAADFLAILLPPRFLPCALLGTQPGLSPRLKLLCRELQQQTMQPVPHTVSDSTINTNGDESGSANAKHANMPAHSGHRPHTGQIQGTIKRQHQMCMLPPGFLTCGGPKQRRCSISTLSLTCDACC